MDNSYSGKFIVAYADKGWTKTRCLIYVVGLLSVLLIVLTASVVVFLFISPHTIAAADENYNRKESHETNQNRSEDTLSEGNPIGPANGKFKRSASSWRAPRYRAHGVRGSSAHRVKPNYRPIGSPGRYRPWHPHPAMAPETVTTGTVQCTETGVTAATGGRDGVPGATCETIFRLVCNKRRKRSLRATSNQRQVALSTRGPQGPPNVPRPSQTPGDLPRSPPGFICNVDNTRDIGEPGVPGGNNCRRVPEIVCS